MNSAHLLSLAAQTSLDQSPLPGLQASSLFAGRHPSSVRRDGKLTHPSQKASPRHDPIASRSRPLKPWPSPVVQTPDASMPVPTAARVRKSRSRRSESFAEEGKYAIERLPRGMAVLIDEVNRQHRVCVLRNAKRVSSRRIDFDRLESVAKLRAEPVEALARASLSSVKRRPRTGTSRLLAMARLSSERCRPRAGALPIGERERRLAEHRCHHSLVNHECQRKVAGQAHADRADALPAKLGVQAAAKRAKPVGDRARLTAPPAARNSRLMQT